MAQAPLHSIKAITQLYPMLHISGYLKGLLTALRSRCPLERKKQVQRGVGLRLSHTASGTDSNSSPGSLLAGAAAAAANCSVFQTFKEEGS